MPLTPDQVHLQKESKATNHKIDGCTGMGWSELPVVLPEARQISCTGAAKQCPAHTDARRV